MGRLKKEKEIPLSVFYLKYFVYLLLGGLLIAVCVILLFNKMILGDMIYPADYAQKQAEIASEEIARAEEVKEEMIPDLCEYLLFDETGKVRAGNMKEGRGEAWKAVQEEISRAGGYYYKVIPREGEYCVLRYRITPEYRSGFLRAYLLPPQTMFITVTLCLAFLLVLITAVCFGRALRKKLDPLILATEKIQNQELEFEIVPSHIREVDRVLDSMERMREALKESLEKQWSLEQSKKEQMSALAHDLKTPLTLIRGNAELLYDLELTEEQRECVDYIENSSLQMQGYVRTLIEVTRSESVLKLQKQKLELSGFLEEIKKQCEGLCAVKQVALQWECDCQEKTVLADPFFLERALLNLCSNAVEYTPLGGSIYFTVYEEEVWTVFEITDTGKGFSDEALRHAKEQFYMEDGSRGSKNHFGIGLYTADSIVRQHGGLLILENSGDPHGARVLVKIPKRE